MEIFKKRLNYAHKIKFDPFKDLAKIFKWKNQ